MEARNRAVKEEDKVEEKKESRILHQCWKKTMNTAKKDCINFKNCIIKRTDLV